MTPAELADILFAAATDNRYVTSGHLLDFTSKALEALDAAGGSTPSRCCQASPASTPSGRAWRRRTHGATRSTRRARPPRKAQIPEALAGERRPWAGGDDLVDVVLDDDPTATVDALLAALREGADPVEVAGTVARAASVRIARFHTSNEFSDWDTALHTFSFANAVEQGLRRARSPELVRGILDASMSVYLDRFLNVPAAQIPAPNCEEDDASLLLDELPRLLDRQQQVNEAGALVAAYLRAGGEEGLLLAGLGSALLPEDRNFHTIQMIEASFTQWSDTREPLFLIAAARYLAAHDPTVRAQGQTFRIAQRLHRDEYLHEGRGGDLARSQERLRMAG